MSRPILIRLLLCLSVVVLLVPCRAQKDGLEPLPRWIASLTLAVNRKDRAEFARVANLPVEQVPAWIFETTTLAWQGTLLASPDNTTRFVTFSAWHTLESDGDHLHPLIEMESGYKLGMETEKETDAGNLKVTHHALNVSFQPARKSAKISDTVLFGWNEKPTKTAIVRLSNDFQVRAVRENDAKGRPIPFQQSGGFVLLETPQESEFSVYFEYEGVVSHRGGDYIQDTEATLNSYWYPHVARRPATATTTVRTPASTWTALGIGELEKETNHPDGTRTLIFRNDVPVCFYTVTAGKYFVSSRMVNGKQLSTYLRDDNPALAEKRLNLLEKAFLYFEQTFGEFPYSRYAIADLRGTFSGALESYSFATFGPGMLPGTIVHELAHTWWGGLVTCTYTRSMWNESFAEYSDALFQREIGNADRSNASRLPELRRNAAAFSAFAMSTAHDTSDGRQASVGYEKGGLVLRVLEEEIGKEKMRASIRGFLSTHARKAPVEWDAFEKSVTKTMGKDTRWFFAQWIERRGMPALSLQNIRTQQRNNGYTVEGEIVQSGTPYRLTLPLRAVTSNGKTLNQTLILNKPRMAFRVQSDTPITSIILDPQRVLPLAAPPNSSNDFDPTVWRARN